MTVLKADTEGRSTSTNLTVDDLVADVNTALGTASLSSQILAVRDGDRVVLKGLAGVTSFALTAETGSPTISQIGFRATQNAEATYGQLSSDATFNLRSTARRRWR